MNAIARRILDLFYTRWSWAYDPAITFVSAGYWYRWVCSAAVFVAMPPVLEVGCGRGRLLAHLAKAGWPVTGVDRSESMVLASRRRLSTAGLPGQVLLADAARLPLADASIGTIVTTFPTEYAMRESTWREFARVLMPHGRWIILDTITADRPVLRLLPLYVLVLLEHNLRPLRSCGDTVSRQYFPRHRRETIPVGATVVHARLLEKE